MGDITLTDVRYRLNAWARWKASMGGYGDSPIGRMQDRTRASVPRSMPPLGVEPPEDVQEVIQAMSALAKDCGPSLECVRIKYLRAGSTTVEDVANVMGFSRQHFTKRCGEGERRIMLWLRAYSRTASVA